MRAILAALVLSVLALTPASAGPDILREKTTGGFAYKRMPLPEAQTQVIQFLWRDGSPLTLPGKEALSTFAPMLMHEGPKGEKRGEINELLRDLQANFRFSVSAELATLTLSAPPAQMAPAADVLKRVLDTPAFSERRLEIFRRQRIAGTKQSLTDADTIAGQLRLRALLPDGPHRRYLMTDVAPLERLTLADIAAWKAKILARDGLIVTTAGPMPADEVGRLIDRLVSGLAAKAERTEPPTLAFAQVGKRVVFEKPELAQTLIVAFGPTTVASGAERFKADLATARLGGSSQGRLFRVLREKLGATYGVSAGLDQMMLGQFAFAIRTSVAHDKAAAVIAEINREYDRWRAEGVTEAELQAVKSQSASAWGENMKQPGTVASMAAFAEIVGLGDATFDSLAAARQAATRDDINAYIRAHFPKGPLGFVIIAPKADGLGADCVIKALDEAARCD